MSFIEKIPQIPVNIPIPIHKMILSFVTPESPGPDAISGHVLSYAKITLMLTNNHSL